jgi:signal transduction histidine kinase
MEELERLKKLNSKILSIASHDLKSPLAVVQNYLQLILDGYTGEINEKQKNILIRSSLRIKELLDIIDNILYFRIDEEQIAKDIKETDLKDIFESCKQKVISLAEEKGVRLNFDIQDVSIKIKVSENHLKKALDNLLRNAIMYSERGGEVYVKLKDEKKSVRILVEDSGIGISKDDLPYIFDEFYRGKNIETRGIGLGLSVVKKIVSSHKGKINVESEESKGTKFEIVLPKI